MATAVDTMPAQDPATEFTVEDDRNLLRELNQKEYKKQAIWFLNAFWKDIFSEDTEAQELVWKAWQACCELDPKKEDGTELDQFTSHRLLTIIDKALTAHELRGCLAEIDLDNSKMMSLAEFLVFKFKVDWRKMVHAPQGQVDEAKLKLAEEKCIESKAAIDKAELAAAEARQALKESVEAELAAKAAAEKAAVAKTDAETSETKSAQEEQVAKDAEAKAQGDESAAFQAESLAKDAEAKATAAAEEQQAVQAQVNEALEAVVREQEAFNNEVKKLEETGNDESLGIVKRNTAKATLAQLKSSDPMPLQRAIISHSAVVRRQERLTKSATAAKMASGQARAKAEESRESAVQQRELAERKRGNATAALRQAEKRRQEATKAHEDAEASKEASETATRHAEKFKAESEAAVTASIEAFQSAQRFLEKVKAECSGAGRGKLWWMWRELEESKKYMSRAQLARLEAAPPLAEDIPAASA